jgi:hypothetical protein
LLFLIFAGVGLWATGSSSQRFGRPAIAGGLGAVSAFALTGVLVAARDVTTLVVKPQSTELQMLRSALDSPGTPTPQRVVFVKPNWTQGAAPLVRYDEFGPPSTYFAWVPNPAVLLVLHERPQSNAHPAIEVLPWDAPAPAATAAPGDAFVDMRKLRKRRVDWTLWTFHAAPRASAADHALSARRP